MRTDVYPHPGTTFSSSELISMYFIPSSSVWRPYGGAGSSMNAHSVSCSTSGGTSAVGKRLRERDTGMTSSYRLSDDGEGDGGTAKTISEGVGEPGRCETDTKTETGVKWEEPPSVGDGLTLGG